MTKLDDASRAAVAIGVPKPLGPRLVAGTMVSTDLAKARDFYEQFLGLRCVRYAPNRIFVADSSAATAMSGDDLDFFVIDVTEVETVANPQRMLHHWGIDVSSAAEVDRIRDVAERSKERFGLKTVTPISQIHGAYSFYFADADMNWWEIEFRLDGLDNEAFFSRGDFPQADVPAGGVRKAPAPEPNNVDCTSVVHGARLTHGTCEQLDLKRARLFMEEVLQLRCVHHLEPAQMFAGSGKFGVFAIRLPRAKSQEFANRWIVSVDGAAAVDEVYLRAQKSAERFELRSVGRHDDVTFGTSCIIQDADGNWWQVAAFDPRELSAYFAHGEAEL
jgi:catechol 2,3-dioxygenase-like lactoylglutathione lyase family enzyme